MPCKYLSILHQSGNSLRRNQGWWKGKQPTVFIIIIIIELYSTNRNKATKEREQKYTVLKENQ